MGERSKPSEGFMLNRVLYDRTKFMAQIVLPAVATLYFALSTTWGLNGTEQVVGTITAIDTFLGVILGISSKSYNNSDAKYDGDMLVIPDGEGGKLVQLALNEDATLLADKQELKFRVKDVDADG